MDRAGKPRDAPSEGQVLCENLQDKHTHTCTQVYTHIHTCTRVHTLRTCTHMHTHTHSRVAGGAPTWPGLSGAPPEVAGRTEGAGRRPRAPPAHVTYVSSYSLTAHTKAAPCTKVYSWFTLWPPREIWYQTGRAALPGLRKIYWSVRRLLGAPVMGIPTP